MPLIDPSRLPPAASDSKFILLLDSVNKAIDKLRIRIIDEIPHREYAPNYVLRSYVAVYFQAYIRRSLALAEAGYDSVLLQRGLVALLCARSIFETAACVLDFCATLSKLIEHAHFPTTAAFVHSHAFATRLPEFIQIDDLGNTTATNVLTLLSKLEGQLPGVKGEYDLLSESAHPNGIGTVGFFDVFADGMVSKFTNHDEQAVHSIRHLASACYLFVPMEEAIAHIEKVMSDLPPATFPKDPSRREKS